MQLKGLDPKGGLPYQLYYYNKVHPKAEIGGENLLGNQNFLKSRPTSYKYTKKFESQV